MTSDAIDAARYRRLRAICLRVGVINIAKIRDEAEFDYVVDNTMTVVVDPGHERRSGRIATASDNGAKQA